MIKLIRVLRLGRIITYMNSTDDVKLSLKLFKLFFFLIMYLHCQGCAWYYVVSLDKVWEPPFMQSLGLDTIYDYPTTKRYWVSFYISVQILAGGDVIPVTNFQIGFSSLLLVLGAIANANIFGNIVVIVSIMNRKASRF